MTQIKVMEQNHYSPGAEAPKQVRSIGPKSLITAGVIALFSVLFLWGFWYNGISVLGFNLSVVWLLILRLFFQDRKNIRTDLYTNIYWLLPLLGIILGFSLYENPFLKGINTILLPLLTLFFCSYSRISITGSKKWNLNFLWNIISRKFSLEEGGQSIVQSIETKKGNIALIQKIVSGVMLLLVINIVIISLLATADSNFAKVVGNLVDVLSFSSATKLSVGILLLLLFVALKISWDETLTISNPKKEKDLDSVIAGIVIGGTLITYFVFIGVQFQSLVIHSAIIETGDSIIALAKNGFWQLFFVSIINILFFFVYYKKTNTSVQSILSVFTIASLIILLSAGHKMYTYVYYYGLSYEKFSASYTVLYFGILFCVMLYFVLNKKTLDILKTSLFLALYMYSFANIFPTEKLIFSVNTTVSERADTKISPYQSHMLSIDILNSVENLQGSPLYETQSWQEWTEKKLKNSEKKKWYEKNLSDF